MTNSTKTQVKLDIPGVADDDDEKGKVNAINDMFAGVSAGVPPLSYAKLPAYLPAQDHHPQLYPWDVNAEHKKANPKKKKKKQGVLI